MNCFTICFIDVNEKYFRRNSSIPSVDNIPCERLSQEKDFIQSLIEQQVCCFNAIESLCYSFLSVLVFYQREEENNAQGMIEKEREKSSFPCSLTETRPPKYGCKFI